MKIEIITIGDEILIGQIADTNAAEMSQMLHEHGYSVKQIISIADNADDIKKTLDYALSETDIVLLTGGLGPTNDDITKKTLCEYFNTKLVFNQQVYEKLEKRLQAMNLKMNDLNKSQAYLPESATFIENETGTAQSMVFEKDGKILISMPGVPSEMRHTMPKVVSLLNNKFGKKENITRHFIVYGIPESELAIRLKDWENSLPSEFHLAYLPTLGLVKLRLSTAENTEDCQQKTAYFSEKLRAILGKAIIAEEDITMEALVGRMLKEKNMTLAVAESCTGGKIAHKITSVPGSSAYFKGGVVAYSNAVKEEVLNVSSFDIDEYGVVSIPIVEQMAQGVLELMDADIAVATSGIAGPASPEDEKEVGTVCIAVATAESVMAQQFKFGSLRDRNIERACLAALVMLKNAIG